MSAIQTTDDLFFKDSGLDRVRTQRLVAEALRGAEDGELYLEYRQSESLLFDDGRLKTAAYDVSQGFGLRSVLGEVSGFAHSSSLNEASLKNATRTVRAVLDGRSGKLDVAAPQGTNRQLYTDANPLEAMPFETKVALLAEIDAFARAKDPRVVQATVSLAGSWQAVQIMRAHGQATADIRPIVRVNVSVMLEQDGRRESGSHGFGGRTEYDQWIQPDKWKEAVAKAIHGAEVNLGAKPAPAGEMCLVLGSGWPGVLLHEAVGHGLEGDFNRKKTSNFSGLMGEQVAAKGVTVVDDGTLPDRRGSITVDDEGTPSAYNTLIEDGKLVGYMQDRQNARLMGMKPTGNGRRQSYAHAPMPRMTNTYMLGGNREPEEIIKSVDKGIYAVNFGGGQVDITSGKFTFQCTEAYEVENGKIGQAVKGATLIGNGPEIMGRISMLGNDMALDSGIGTCGKQGQGVPVGIGQPTLKIDAITVGGTG